jgi:PAS domain S-box-containing protein
LGYSREEFIEKKIWQVGAFKDIEASKDAFEALQKNEYIRYENLPLRAKGGRLIQVEFVSNVYPAGDEKVIQCNIRDITEHKQLVAALQENERKYRTLVAQSPDGIFLVDLSGNFLAVNKAMCESLGFSEEEFRSMNIWDIVPERHLEQHRKRLARILNGECLNDALEYTVRGKDGKIRSIEVLSAPYYREKGIIGFQGIARDITACRRAVEVLQKSEAKLKEAQVLGRIGNWEFDLDKQTIQWSDEVYRLYERDPSTGPPNVEEEAAYYSHEQAERLHEYARLAAEQGRAFEFDLEARLPSGRVAHFGAILRPVKDESGRIVKLFGTVQDITERRQAEEAQRKSEFNLRALSVELSRAEEHERQRLALFLHDEIGQSLALLRMKLGGLAAARKWKSGKQDIQQALDVLEKVIDQTHKLTFELSPPVLHQLGLEAALEWMGEKIGKDFGIEFTFSDDGMMKHLEDDLKVLLFRCVRELMMNIVKHAKARRMTVSLTQRGKRVAVVTEDDGIGFDTSLLEGHPDQTGFGLFSVRERLVATGGTFELRSEPGRGTRITLSVPLKEEMPSS